ncbi:hypothetical protein GIF22_09740 [Campylobacter coli]|nr:MULTISPECIES: hypothetical protein [Campylobacterales]EDO7083193.1 hypothetical protein [Campylobacter coli]EDO7083629.1 hypothetical protein [Campylobacter coli]EGY4820559.1 hypothetical protein [Campylobacter coli]EHH1545883.1 hypothetical protein [Campylobacter coli]EIF1968003.1 hypothetical protein [Campylobacter coli]
MSKHARKRRKNYIDNEGYLQWEAEEDDRIKRAKEIWQKVKHIDQTKQLATAF